MTNGLLGRRVLRQRAGGCRGRVADAEGRLAAVDAAAGDCRAGQLTLRVGRAARAHRGAAAAAAATTAAPTAAPAAPAAAAAARSARAGRLRDHVAGAQGDMAAVA